MILDSLNLSRTTPEAEGVPSEFIHHFVDGVEGKEIELHSLMVLRQGRVIAEGWWSPYRAEDIHILFSLTKSFTSTAIGLAVADGRLSVDDLVLDHFPGDAPPDPNENLKTMRVRDLLAMATGHDQDQVPGPERMRQFLAQPVPFAPGTHFYYNSSASNALSYLIQKTTGQTAEQYLTPRLFEPLGIESRRWEQFPDGASIGGWGLYLQTESIAKFGQLYLQRGIWNGKQVVLPEWVDLATRSHVDNSQGRSGDWAVGYGFQFWRCRHDAFRGDGAFGQYCVIVPALDMVVAITSCVDDMQAVLDLLWSCIVVPLRSGECVFGRSSQELAERLKSLSLPTVAGLRSTSLAGTVTGQSFKLPGVADPVVLTFEDSGDMTLKAGERLMRAGYGKWVRNDWEPIGNAVRPTGVCGAWTLEDTYTFKTHSLEGTASRTLQCRFTPDRLTISSKGRGWFGASEEVFVGEQVS